MPDIFAISIDNIVKEYNRIKLENQRLSEENKRLIQENEMLNQKYRTFLKDSKIKHQTAVEDCNIRNKDNSFLDKFDETNQANTEIDEELSSMKVKNLQNESKQLKKRKILSDNGEDSGIDVEVSSSQESQVVKYLNKSSPIKSSPVESSPIKSSPFISYPSRPFDKLSPVKAMNTISPLKLNLQAPESTLTSPEKFPKLKSFILLSPGKKGDSEMRSRSLYHIKGYNSQLPTQYSDDSSPIKSSNGKVDFSKLPTQYSSDENKELSRSRAKSENRSPAIDVIEDSENDSDSLLISNVSPLNDITNFAVPDMPKPHTKLQRRDFVNKFYIRKFYNDPQFKINLTQNPITESNWILIDFKTNPNYIKPASSRKVGYSKHQQQNIDMFYEIANKGIHSGKLPQNLHNPHQINESQLFDKFPSPPGFMISDFPSTQEELSRKQIIKERQSERITRRIYSCLILSNNIQTGEFVFFYDILNKYVQHQRYIIS